MNHKIRGHQSHLSNRARAGLVLRRAGAKDLVPACGRNRSRKRIPPGMADPATNAADCRYRADVGWLLVDHWICRTSRRSYRDNLDVDLDYPGREWQFSDAD
jgi:hypothetical protein